MINHLYVLIVINLSSKDTYWLVIIYFYGFNSSVTILQNNSTVPIKNVTGKLNYLLRNTNSVIDDLLCLLIGSGTSV